jgi:hypothetical protein
MLLNFKRWSSSRNTLKYVFFYQREIFLYHWIWYLVSARLIDWTNFCVCMGLEWNHVHYYCGHLLAYCASPGWEMAVIVEQMVEFMNDRGNRSTRRKPALVPLCLPEIPHYTTKFGTRAAAVQSRGLTAWPMARAHRLLYSLLREGVLDLQVTKTCQVTEMILRTCKVIGYLVPSRGDYRFVRW